MPVQVQAEYIDHCRVALSIEVPGDVLGKQFKTLYSQQAARTEVPGFRAGKAPPQIIRRFIDEDRLRQLALERSVQNAYQQAIREHKLQPFNQAEPKLELPEEEIVFEQGFKFKATVALDPHVHLGELEGLTGRLVRTQATDADVERRLLELQTTHSTRTATDEPAQEGDVVRVSYRVEVEGVIVEESDPDKPARLEIGGNLPEFDQALLGLTAGSDKSFTVAYPEAYESEELRGQSANATVHVYEVLRSVKPDLETELPAKMEEPDLPALRVRVQSELQEVLDQMANQQLNDAIFREVVRRSTVHYPQEMVEVEVTNRMSALLERLEKAELTLEQFLDANNTDFPSLQKRYSDEAIETITHSLVAHALAQAHGLYATREEVDALIRERADEEKVSEREMRRVMEEMGELEEATTGLFLSKLTTFLRSQATITEVGP
jgi:trigger factor